MSHWTIDPSLGCCDESLNHWSKSGMLWWVTEPLIQVWDAVMSHWTSLGCCDESLNHWSKSGMLWWISKLLIQVWDAVMNLKTIDPSLGPTLGCCDKSLNHSSISGMNELTKSVVVQAFVRTTDWKPVERSLVVEAFAQVKIICYKCDGSFVCLHGRQKKLQRMWELSHLLT